MSEPSREDETAFKLCKEWQESQHRQHGFAIDELSAFMAGVKAARAAKPERERVIEEPPLAKLLKEVDPGLADILTDNAAYVGLIRSNVIEECAKVLDACADDWRRIRDPGMANNAASYAKKIRALKGDPA